jgi:trimeric autotransporter adhesin
MLRQTCRTPHQPTSTRVLMSSTYSCGVRRVPLTAISAVLVAGLFISACDAVAPTEVTIQGAVTTQLAHDAEGESVQDATVRSREVRDDGSQRPIEGEATTDAQGQYALVTETTARPVVVEATWDDQRAAVALEAGAATSSSVQAPPMTGETTAQADVFVEAHALSPLVTVADAAAYVSARTAAAIRQGTTTAAQVGTALAASVQAESRFALHAEGGALTQATVNAVRQHRVNAYAQLRTQMHAATTVQARRAAVDAFLETYAAATTGAGVGARQQAQVALTVFGAAQRFAGAHATAAFATYQRAQLVAATKLAHAVEAEFQSAGAAAARLQALAQARATLLAEIRAATTAQAVAIAFTNYRATVRTHLIEQTNRPAADIDAALAATTTARAALNTAVLGATTGQAVADAYVTFFAAARQAAQGELIAAAWWSAEVIALLAAF